jgi:iron complex outermembrane receptor protein
MPQFTRTSLAALAIASVAPMMWCDAASAQESGGIRDIVVTARKREESIQNVPIAVTALSAEALANQSVQSVKDIQYQTPSLTIAPTNADRNSLAIGIRGQSVSDTLLTVDPSIGIYIDGVNFAKTVGTELSTLVDVERVEVLKGPQGTLFGRNTTGGALSITTKLPSDEFEGQLIGRTDLYGRAGVSAIVNVPVGETLALRLVGSYDRRDSFGKNRITGQGVGGDLDGGAIRGTARWQPTDRLEVVLRGDYNKTSTSAQAFKARYMGGAGTAAAAAGEIIAEGGATNLAGAAAAYIADGNTSKFWDSNQNVQDNRSRVKSYGGSGTVSFDLTDDVQLKSITSYRRLTRDTLMDMDGSRFAILEVNGITSQKLFAQEAQLTGQAFDGNLDYIVGGFYSRETGNDGTRTFALRRLTNNTQSFVDGDVVNKSVAGYGQFTYRFDERFSFTGGLRYTKDTKSLTSRNRSVNGLGVVACNVPAPEPGTCSQSFKNSWDDWSYTAVLDYKPVQGTLVYVKTSRGFRSGGFNLRGTADPQTFTPFGPENVTDYEVGLKTDLFDRRLRVNLAGFRSGYKGIQKSIIYASPFPPFTSTVVQNAASARIYGLEAEITAKPTDALTLRATGAMLDAKFNKYVDGLGRDLSDLKFNLTPKWTYTLSAGYDVPVEGGPLHLQVDWVWQDDIYFFSDSVYNGRNGNPDLRGQPAYGLLNGRISKTFEKEGVDVAFFIRNALNKKFYSASLDTASSLGFSSFVVGDPRLVGAEASIKF